MANYGEKVSCNWNIADLLSGPYQPNRYKESIGFIREYRSTLISAAVNGKIYVCNQTREEAT